MAKILKFRGKQDTEKDRETPRVDYRDKIRSHRFTIMYRSILIVVLVAALIGAYYLQWNGKVYTECVPVSSVEKSTAAESSFLELSGNVLVYSEDGAGCFDTKGNAIWNVTYEMQHPLLSISGDMVAIGDNNARTIYLMNGSGSVGEVSTPLPIYQFCVSESGILAVALNDTDITWIYLYDSTGRELTYFKTTMQQSGYPMDIAISPNGELVGISFLYVNSGEMKTRVAFYNFGAVGQNETDNYVSGYDYQGVVVPSIRFMNGKSAYAVADDRLIFFSGNQKPVSIAEHLVSDEILSVFSGDEYVGLVFDSNEPDKRYRLEVYNSSGESAMTEDFDLDYTDILIRDGYVYIYNEAKCKIYSLSGRLKYDGTFGRSAGLLIPEKNFGKLTLVSHESLDLLQLK